MAPIVGRVVAAAYVGAAGALAATGMLTQNPWWFVPAVGLTVPLGLVAFVAIYPGYAFLQAAGGLLASPTAPDGSQSTWLASANGVLVVVLFLAAAIGNVVLVPRWRRPTRPLPARDMVGNR